MFLRNVDNSVAGKLIGLGCGVLLQWLSWCGRLCMHCMCGCAWAM